MRVNWKWVVPILAMGLGVVLVALAQGHSIREDRLAALLLPALYVASGLALLIGMRWGRDLLIVSAIGSLALLLPSLVAPGTMSAISGLIALTVGSDHLTVKEIIFSICALAAAVFANRALPGSDDSSKWSLLLRWTRFPPVVLFVACILWGIALTLVSVLWAHFGYLRYVASEDLPTLLEKYIDSFKANYFDYGGFVLVPSVVTWVVIIAPLFYFSPRILRRFSLPPIVSSSILAGAILGASGTSAAFIIDVWQNPENTQFVAALLGALVPFSESVLVAILGYLLGGVAGYLVGNLLLFPIRDHSVSQS
jgi:hypothetical protein